MRVEITILTDNTAGYCFLAEWGLSILLKVDNLRLLYDCGFTDTAVRNADLLKVDLTSLDAIVLSHGHVDHTGGLPHVLARSGARRIIAHPAVFERKLRRTANSPDREIGIMTVAEELRSTGGQLTLVTTPQEVFPGIITSGEVPMSTTFEHIDEGLYHAASGRVEPDPLLDDLSLAIRTEAGLVILLGCAHRGPINIIRHFQQLTGEERVYAIIGGMHLMRSLAGRISETVRALKALGVKKLFCGHCTGFDAMVRLANEFGDVFRPLAAGIGIALPFGLPYDFQ